MKCKIRFNKNNGNTHISQVLTGYKLLENTGILDLEISDRHIEFRKSNLYDHNSIVEVEIGDELIAYDMGDGYQSIVDKDLFDSHLDKVSYYFKRSYLGKFHKGMRNEDKIKPFGLNYHCTCKGNPYDFVEAQPFSLKDLKTRLSFWHGNYVWEKLINYKNFVSNFHYKSYKILFLTRLWDSDSISLENLHSSFPTLNSNKLYELAENWKSDLNVVTNNRIQLLYALKKYFGQLFVGGVEDSKIARKLCPDLIVDQKYTSKKYFMNQLRSNYVCIASEGLHHSIGWKTAEYVTNGRAFVTEPLYYEVTGNFSAPFNYLEYDSTENCINLCEKILKDVDLIHYIENNNATYYKNYLAPDQIIKRSLEVAHIL